MLKRHTLTEDKLCKSNCGHVFCKPCIYKWLAKSKFSCPMCRESMTYFYYKTEKYNIGKMVYYE